MIEIIQKKPYSFTFKIGNYFIVNAIENPNKNYHFSIMLTNILVQGRKPKNIWNKKIIKMIRKNWEKDMQMLESQLRFEYTFVTYFASSRLKFLLLNSLYNPNLVVRSGQSSHSERVISSKHWSMLELHTKLYCSNYMTT